jgi:hypothetical protein
MGVFSTFLLNYSQTWAKTITLRLKDDVCDVFLEAALAENCPVSNLIEPAAITKIPEQQFTDDVEMAEINADRKLIKRIRQGCREARLREGRLIDIKMASAQTGVSQTSAPPK